MLKSAAFPGHLCFAPSAGQNVRFTRPDSWVRKLLPVDAVHALSELTRRYLTAYGPATREDYSRWLGVGSARTKALIVGLGDEVTEVDLQGTKAWLLARDLAAAKNLNHRDRFGCRPRSINTSWRRRYTSASCCRAISRRPIFRSQGWISPLLMVGGRMDGVWRHEKRASGWRYRSSPL
jgi:hypothetical protein